MTFSLNCHAHFRFIIHFQDSLDGVPEILLDPNGLSKDDTISVNRCVVSQDAKYFAYGLSTSRSNWMNIKVMRIKDRMVEPDTLSWVKVSGISWTHDSRGFFYSRYLPPIEGKEFAAASKISAGTETNANLDHQLYCHFLGSVTEDGKVSFLHKQTLITIVAGLEIIRRGIWNF
ncbi:hypothetical protein POM88_027181 [Heracleum sosnowskyi]|uniref:Peptidase S9A N-terminal domain-containing protein n=1 Tax=Heracleum sosnowskyi TaxID=360622 RepID=A0AAD8I764_9APIA|nr:hypothetical protein POM88_027181 [Heracleum sosnowskyi]